MVHWIAPCDCREAVCHCCRPHVWRRHKEARQNSEPEENLWPFFSLLFFLKKVPCLVSPCPSTGSDFLGHTGQAKTTTGHCKFWEISSISEKRCDLRAVTKICIHGSLASPHVPSARKECSLTACFQPVRYTCLEVPRVWLHSQHSPTTRAVSVLGGGDFTQKD